MPLNLFGMARPITNLLTFIPPTLVAINTLDRNESVAHEDATKTLLAYYVIFGLVQFLESLASGVLAKRIRES